MSRAFLVVMDSVGIGGAPDADQFFNGNLPDTGANTLGHIAEACAAGQAEEGRSGPLHVPNLDSLGLGAALKLASGMTPPGLGAVPQGLWGAATEISRGKDTPSGHWELAGLPVPWEWHYFPDKTPAFPDDLTACVAELAGSDGILGNCHASGTAIIAEHGATHVKTGRPICYTSADSVFQIAAHEESFGLDRLLTLCETLAPRLHEMKVGRVIARPFTGTSETGFQRTVNRRDYAITPPAPILTDWVQAAGGQVHAIGKIGDIFSMQGIDDVVKGDDATLLTRLAERVSNAGDQSLTFANFVEFDSLYGHRRDISGYARALESFDASIGPVLLALRPGDLMILTADHGNDPSWSGTDHTRERVPVLCAGCGAGSLGQIAFADVAASVAAHLGVPQTGPGQSFLPVPRHVER
ncbi:MAG: phosphopentomutase [Arenibacterium sp.]